MKEVLLIAGSFTSANFNVMLDVIRAKYGKDLMIHAISANNDSDELLSRYDDVTYYPVFNYKLYLGKKRKEYPTMINRLLFSLICLMTNTTENFFPLSFERKIYHIGKKIIREHTIEEAFSVCIPFYSHRVANRIVKKSGIRWLSFWVDPYLNKGIQTSRLQHAMHRYAEKQNLKNSQEVYALPEVFNNHELYEEFKEKIKTFEIPYIKDRKIETKNYDVIFAGLFYQGVREPEPMFEIVLEALPNLPEYVYFKFYVRNPGDYQLITERSKGRMLFYDFINRIELNKILSNCYMLMNVGNKSTVQMPSKVVEYISYRKPILFFYCEEQDRSFRYLSDYPDILSVDVNKEKNQSAKLLVEYFKRKHTPVSYESLMTNPLYERSSPSFIRKLLQ